MRIEYAKTPPVTLHSSDKQSEAVKQNAENKGTEESSDDTVYISFNGRKKLEQESETAKDKLPTHIEEMIRAIERLIEQIEAAEEALEQAKAAEYQDEETKREVIEVHQGQVNSLEQARFGALQMLQESMKEAGVSEPGIIAELMR